MEVYLDRRELHNCFKRLPIIIAAVDADKDKEQHQKQSEEKKSAPLSNVKDSKNNNTADTYPTQQPLQNHSQQSTCQPKQRQNHPLYNSTNTLNNNQPSRTNHHHHHHQQQQQHQNFL